MNLTAEKLDFTNDEHCEAAFEISGWTHEIRTVGKATVRDMMGYPNAWIGFDDEAITEYGYRVPAGFIALTAFTEGHASGATAVVGCHVTNPTPQYMRQGIGRHMLCEPLIYLATIPNLTSVKAYVNDTSAALYAQTGAQINRLARDVLTMPDPMTGCFHVADLLPAIEMVRLRRAVTVPFAMPEPSEAYLLN